MFTQPLTDEDIDRLEGIIKSGDPIRAATAAVELMVEVKRLRTDLQRCEKRRRGSIDAYSRLLNDARKERDDAKAELEEWLNRTRG